MAFTMITVTGGYQRPDGTPATGTATFTPTGSMRNTAGPAETVMAAPVVGQIAAGTLTASLAATDDPDTLPADVLYDVAVRIYGSPDVDTYRIAVPAGGGPIDLDTHPRQ